MQIEIDAQVFVGLKRYLEKLDAIRNMPASEFYESIKDEKLLKESKAKPGDAPFFLLGEFRSLSGFICDYARRAGFFAAPPIESNRISIGNLITLTAREILIVELRNGTPSTLTELSINPEAHSLKSAKGVIFDVIGHSWPDYLLKRREAIADEPS